ncbi:serine/threonine protein kinase [bacterium]|nr:serine/threonine protein kinase [bacterium]
MADVPFGSAPSAPPPPPSGREKDLLLGRLALRARWVTGPALVEALLVQSAGGAKRPLGEVLVERGALLSERRIQLQQMLSVPRVKDDDEEVEAPPDTSPDPRLGKVLAGVRLDTRLEATPLFRRYAGRRANDPEPVIVKLVHASALQQGLWMDSIETARACVRIKSPNLVPHLDVTRAEGGFAIVTRYVDGFSAATLIERVRRVRLSEALRICKEAARGLRDLHRENIVHRCLRPHSIWLSKKGEVLLRDVGFALEPPGVRRVAERGVIFGSPGHMAPEIARGELAEGRADTYALGCVLYEMATGVRPFEGLGIADLMSQHVQDPPIPPNKFLPDIPAPASELIVGMLAKKKEDRPTDDELVSALERLEAAAPKPGLTRRLGPGEGAPPP